MQNKKLAEGVSEGQLANASASCGTLHGVIVGGADADGEHLTTYPPPPFTSPRQIYELSTGMSPLVRAYMCVLVLCPCVGAGFTQGSLYLLRSKHTRRGPPVSYQRPSLH